MKKILLFLLIFSLSFIYCYPQYKKTNESDQIKIELVDSIVSLKKKISLLENKLSLSDSIFGDQIEIITQSLDSMTKNIDDTRLRESIKSSESLINKQNLLIDGFSSIFTILTLLLGLVTLGVPILIYFLSIKPANTALKKAKQKFELEIKNYSNEQINEAIKNLKSKNHILIINSLNHILSIVPKKKFTEKQIYELYSIAKYENIEINSKESIVFLISNFNFPFCKNYFFDLISEQVVTLKDNNLKNFAFNYLINFHKSEKYLLTQINQLVVNSEKKKESILVLLDLLVPDNVDLIWSLLSFEPLIRLFTPEELVFIDEQLKLRDYIIQDSITENIDLYRESKLEEMLSRTLMRQTILETIDVYKKCQR